MMASVSANPLLKAARWYAKRNIFVFPLHNVEDDGSCSCRDAECKNQGKHPRTQHGFKDATIDLEKIGQWWTTFPKANIGIACEPTGWAVIDVDPRHGGDETLRDLEQQYGPLPDTVRQVTGSGGQHIVFTYPFGGAPTIAGIRPGIDTRARGGYIVGAPSAHVSGNAYAWEVAPGEMPLAELPHWFRDLLTTRTERQRTDEPGAVIPEGRRDETLASLAGSMRARGHTKEEIAAALLVTNRDRCVPPLDERDVRRIAWSISQYEAGKGAFVGNGESRHAEGLDGRVLLDEAIQQGVQPPEWVIEDLVVRGRIHLLYAEPESGKTIIALSWMLEVIARGGSVVFVDEESGMAGIATLLADMGIESVDEHLHYFPFVGLAIEDAEVLVAYVEQVGAEMVVFDSLTDMLAQAGVDENNGIEVTKWMLGVAQRLARLELAPSVVLIDHVPKDTENIRYAVASRAKKAKADVQWFAKKTEDFDRTKTAFVDLERHKNRPGVLPKKVRYTVGGKDGRLICRRFDSSQDAITALPPRADEFLAVLRRGPASRIDVEREMGIGHDSAYRLANALTKAGLVEPKGYGRAQRYHLIVRSDDSNRLADDSESSDESSDFGGLKGPDRTIRRSADKRPWWEKLDDDEEDLV